MAVKTGDMQTATVAQIMLDSGKGKLNEFLCRTIRLQTANVFCEFEALTACRSGDTGPQSWLREIWWKNSLKTKSEKNANNRKKVSEKQK